MQGRQFFDPCAETVISLESFVPKDHFLRKIDRELDLSFVRELTAPCYADGLGRPSIDPEVFFRMHNWWLIFTASIRNGAFVKTSIATWRTAGSAACRQTMTCRIIHR